MKVFTIKELPTDVYSTSGHIIRKFDKFKKIELPDEDAKFLMSFGIACQMADEKENVDIKYEESWKNADEKQAQG